MLLKQILEQRRIYYVDGQMSKKRVLELICSMLAQSIEGADAKTLFQLFIEREKLGSTAIGHGIAIPHIRSDLVSKTIGVFIVLEQGIEFDSPDNQPVNLFFALVAPENAAQDHLQSLKQISQLLSDKTFREKILNCKDSDELRQLILARLDQTEELSHVQ
ncbi:MAG: PTS sugar transporter subunit IIA [Pseudomonadota bacterium]